MDEDKQEIDIHQYITLRRCDFSRYMVRSAYDARIDLECHTHLPSDLPLLAFEVSDIEELWHKLQHGEVKMESINTDHFIGKYFIFYDPDGNSYHAVEHKEKKKA